MYEKIKSHPKFRSLTKAQRRSALGQLAQQWSRRDGLTFLERAGVLVPMVDRGPDYCHYYPNEKGCCPICGEKWVEVYNVGFGCVNESCWNYYRHEDGVTSCWEGK